MDDLVSGPLKIVAIDPGGTTGVAVYSATVMLDWKGNAEYYNEKWTRVEIGPEPHHSALYQLLSMQRVTNFRVVCESFQNRGIDKDLSPVEIIGVVNLFVQETAHFSTYKGRELLWWQTASTINGDDAFWRDDKLLQVNLYEPNRRHANDATAHLLHHLTFTMNRKDILRRLK